MVRVMIILNMLDEETHRVQISDTVKTQRVVNIAKQKKWAAEAATTNCR